MAHLLDIEMEKLTETVSVKLTAEMAETIRAIAKAEGLTVCDLGRALFALKIDEARERYLANRKLDSIFSQDVK